MTETSDSGQRSVVLIGLRGSGKSSVGCELAALLGGECVDTDERVVQAAGRSIAEIFGGEGESGFRRREQEAIERVAAERPAVVAVGGGAVLIDANVARLRSIGDVVWLTAPVDVLWQRISSDADTRASRPPLTSLAGPAELERLLIELARTGRAIREREEVPR